MDSETTHFGNQTIKAKLKTQKVASVFHSVSNQYDLMNDLMSFGLHRLWKRTAVARCDLQPNDWILDLAGGTGDLSYHFANKIGPEGKIIIADINDRMIKEGHTKLLNAGITKAVSYAQANAELLPFHDQAFDKVAIAFGLRNVTYKEIALKEMYRVLKPGGRLVILEFSELNVKPLKPFYDAYSFQVIPKLGEWICHDQASYRYLVESIRLHPNQEALKTMIIDAGFKRCDYQNLHGGIVAIHSGYKQ